MKRNLALQSGINTGWCYSGNKCVNVEHIHHGATRFMWKSGHFNANCRMKRVNDTGSFKPMKQQRKMNKTVSDKISKIVTHQDSFLCDAHETSEINTFSFGSFGKNEKLCFSYWPVKSDVSKKHVCGKVTRKALSGLDCNENTEFFLLGNDLTFSFIGSESCHFIVKESLGSRAVQ